MLKIFIIILNIKKIKKAQNYVSRDMNLNARTRIHLYLDKEGVAANAQNMYNGIS